MSILEFYKENEIKFKTTDSEYTLLQYHDSYYIGKDNDGWTSIIFKSLEPKRDPVSMKTKKISVECNREVEFYLNNSKYYDICNILKCSSDNKHDIELFLQLVETYFLQDLPKMNYIIDVFQTLNDFFEKPETITKSEALGLYGELYTIYHFKDIFNFSRFWQTKEMMNFDFSITERVKLEIKTTIKEDRKHHFRYNQLNNSLGDIYILSYMLKEDDNGLSLKELIKQCLPLLSEYPTKKARLVAILNNEANTYELNNCNYLESYTLENMKFIDSKDIPKIDQDPTNVTKIEFDSNCNDCQFIDCDRVISIFNYAINDIES